MLLALISPGDKHHAEAIRLLDRFLGDSRLSPYSLMELDLLLRSGEIVVEEVKAFYTTLSKLFRYREISSLPDKPIYHGEAHELRRKYNKLTYFDSLHASVGITENLELVSYNKIYEDIVELECSHPKNYI